MNQHVMLSAESTQRELQPLHMTQSKYSLRVTEGYFYKLVCVQNHGDCVLGEATLTFTPMVVKKIQIQWAIVFHCIV